MYANILLLTVLNNVKFNLCLFCFFGSRDLHERCLRNFSNKLSCLNRLLCSIYHLRTKDLRSKVGK